ncbi:hypothetical protein Ccr32_gp066 [Caulobacter phage Ccr32]|nr:HNH endonuclease [Caulobacter phage phiCbK]AFU86898.1 putative HNH endonuclease [Caulobacter phage phiCbK]ARB14985.1 hypothetical protein Ccr32_gp066 [Caulobacter phage Ccr32]ARB15316.1 hypothetical protein Ccr34_gp067 [Caulobacter phage Ccr34]
MMAATSTTSVATHRTYPGKLIAPAPGHCRWCTGPILKPDGSINRRKTFCSQVCVSHYLLRADPAEMRRHVFFRDQGVCAACKKRWLYLDDSGWQADHIEPLFLAFGDLAYWEPENVQVLCTDPCHKQKSADDMRKYGFVLKLTRERKQPEKRRRLAERLS